MASVTRAPWSEVCTALTLPTGMPAMRTSEPSTSPAASLTWKESRYCGGSGPKRWPVLIDMKSSPLRESRAKKRMMVAFWRMRVLGMPTTNEVAPELLEEAARLRGAEAARGTRGCLVSLEAGIGVRTRRARGLGDGKNRGLDQRLDRGRQRGAGDVLARGHAHDPPEVLVL